MDKIRPLRIALAGNPNVGKTTLFNRLTGSRHRVGNYAGVTVESRSGWIAAASGTGERIELVDLPGTYSLSPVAEDEAAVLRHICGSGTGDERPDLVLLVVDASNLARNLYLFLQLQEFGVPLVLALNMVDEARRVGLPADAARLEAVLGVPVIETVASTGAGMTELVAALRAFDRREPIASGSNASKDRWDSARGRSLLVSAAAGTEAFLEPTPEEQEALRSFAPDELRERAVQVIEARHVRVDALLEFLPRPERTAAVAPAMQVSHKIDGILTHRVFGPALFLVVMTLLFQAMFSWAQPIMDVLDGRFSAARTWVLELLGPGAIADLLANGVIAGVGNVVTFVPQIALLFLFVGLLEDSGYMARAAFIADRVMASVGLNGRAFVPLLSGFACAIPAILGTRTISNFRDRLVVILMIPFMSCSARLPVYALLISAFFPATDSLVGPLTVGGALLTSMYLLSTLSALAVGAVYRRTILPGPTPTLVLELPPYRIPRLRNALLNVWDRTKDFLRDAGSIILVVTILLWGALTYPRVDSDQLPAGKTPIEMSIGGRFGHALDPVLSPLGQDWRIGVGLVGSFAAREVLVSTLGLVYGIEAADEDDAPLRERMRPDHTPASALALMVFFVYACQCMSTLAVVRRETRSWRWPLFMLLSMNVLAWVMAFVTYRVALMCGLG